MRQKKIVVIVLMVAILLIPAVLKAQTASVPAAPAISETEVREFISKYVDRYKAKDVDLFMELFSKEAIENRMVPYPDIRRIYEKTFAMTEQFLYYVNLLVVQTHTESAFASGRYRISQTLAGKDETKMFQGNIQWELVREGDALKILRINFGKDLQPPKSWLKEHL